MRKFEEIVEVINEVVTTCRENSYCHSCPYWNVEKGECRIQMETKADDTPYVW